MERVLLELKFSGDPYGQRILKGKLTVPEESRLLLFGWYQRKMAWFKASKSFTNLDIELFYHILPGSKIQLLMQTRGDYSPPAWNDVTLPSAHRPTGNTSCIVRYDEPSVFYQDGSHGVGCILLRKASGQGYKKGIWRIRPTGMNEKLAPFTTALLAGRAGKLSEHPWYAE